jgi:hypothetical protein
VLAVPEIREGKCSRSARPKSSQALLSSEQRAQFEVDGYFDVTGCDSGRRYRIYQSTATNVIELDETGARRTGWCFMPVGDLVAGDVMLAQKIALETNELGALAVAQKFSGPFLTRV